MKSRRVNRFLAILGACALFMTSTPLTASATESVSGNNATEEKVSEENTKVGDTDTVSGNDEEPAEDGSERETKSPVEVAAKIAMDAAKGAAETKGETGDAPILDIDPIPYDPGTQTPKIEVDAESGKSVYYPIISEFESSLNPETNSYLVKEFKPTLDQSYDAVYLPSGGTTFLGKTAQYGTDILTQLSTMKKGIIFSSGAELVTSSQNLNIDYVRFEDGSKAAPTANTFKGWSKLTDVIGYGEAVAAYGTDTADFNGTFSGCTKLTNVTLDLSGITASFDDTFAGVKDVGSIQIKNGTITSIRNLNNCGALEFVSSEIGAISDRDVTFNNITFADNDTDYLDHAFTNMPGNVIFTNCKSGESDLLNFNMAYADSTVMKYVSTYDDDTSISLEPGASSGYNTKCTSLDIKVSGASAYSANGMFENAQAKNIDLTGFITAETKSMDAMFKGATFADVKGVDSWRLGAATADEMFAGTRVYYGPKSYLTSNLIPSIKNLNWSKVTSASKLFSFNYKGGYNIDYSNMDLSSVENMEVSSLANYDFITPAKNPKNYVFEQHVIYIASAGSEFGGKALDPVTVSDGKISGSEIPTNTRVYTDKASITTVNTSVTTNNPVAVIPGYKLSEYLDPDISYYQDRSLTRPISGDLVVNRGDDIVVYYGIADESPETEMVNVTVDYSNMTDSDFNKHVSYVKSASSLKGKSLLFLSYKYNDNTESMSSSSFALTEGVKVYTVPVEVRKKTISGLTFTEYTNIETTQYSGSNYEPAVDLKNLKITFNPVGADSVESTRYNFAVKVVDNNNAGKTRPERLMIDFTAKYGNYTRTKTVEVNLLGMSGNSTSAYVEFPNTVGGVVMSSLDATTNTSSSNYSSVWDNTNKLFKYILAGATDTDPDPKPTIDPATVSITFVGDIASARPERVTLTMQDSKGGNAVTKTLNTTFSPTTNYYADTFQRLVDDVYHVSGVSGIDSTKYKVEYSGLNVTATYTGGSTVTPNYTRKVTINFEDSNNEAGLRPKSIKITVANESGSDSVTSDVTIGDANSYTADVNVTSATDTYKVKSVAGLPESYTTSINGLTITCKYTPEKITKTYKVVWSGDGDNTDKTRPASVQLTVKNSGTTVQTATVSEDTNWTANVSLNKFIKGIEASYTVEGADVSNYSKEVSGDTVTYKFTGTLSKDAAAVEANKGNGTNADGTGSVNENDYSIDNFDWIDYANRYPDLKKAFGYNKEALYAHYIRYGIGEGRIATFTGKYATVNEDILKAYFPEDYKYKTNLSTVGEEYLIGVDKNTSATSSGNKVTVDSNGNIHTTVKNPDGTVTETVTDVDGNIISVSTYKTGDLRLEDMSIWFIVLGVLLLSIAGMLIRVVIKDDKQKKYVLSMIS